MVFGSYQVKLNIHMMQKPTALKKSEGKKRLEPSEEHFGVLYVVTCWFLMA